MILCIILYIYTYYVIYNQDTWSGVLIYLYFLLSYDLSFSPETDSPCFFTLLNVLFINLYTFYYYYINHTNINQSYTIL